MNLIRYRDAVYRRTVRRPVAIRHAGAMYRVAKLTAPDLMDEFYSR